MPRKLVHFVFLVLLCAPIQAFGLGLGDITLDSSLNEPLQASIALNAVQQGDLVNFKANVASAETFKRYGLDRPAFLGSLRFEVSTAGAQPRLLVRSTSAITEPFVTFLVEANWGSGRLLREYTVLLDPPVFNPQSAAPPIQAPQTATSQAARGSGFVPRREPAPAPAPRRPVAAAIAGTSYGPVRRNETLWAIADGARSGSGLTINQMMIAIYRANPDAFLGNINLLKEGATLSLPAVGQAAQVSRQDAFTQAREHNQRWRAGGTVARTPATSATAPVAQAEDGRRLRLVAPEGGATDAASLSALQQQLQDEQSLNSELTQQIDSLRKELAESERLFNLRNSDLADMQARLAREQAAADTTGEVDVSQIDAQPAEPVAVDDTPTDETSAAAVADTGADATPAGTPPEPAAAPVSTPQAPVASTPAPIQSAPSMLDRVIGFFAGVWPFLIGGLALLGGLLWWRSRRGESADDETWEALSRDSAVPTTDAVAAQTSQMEVTEGPVSDADVEFFEDTGTFKPIDFSEAESDAGLESQAADADAQAPASAADFPFEDTVAGEEESLKLDQSDPLAEADFHIAYGLYDQAADLIRTASEREPERRDLKMKLIEIFFVWGNKESFLSTAKALRDEIGSGPDRDWDKVVIFGRQICPDDELFSGASTAASADMVDLELDETGVATMDLDTDSSGGDADMDFDLGDALEAASDNVASVDNVIDFDFSGTAIEASDDTADTIREKLEAAADQAEDTEELDLADVGIDLDFTESIKIDDQLGGDQAQSEVIDIDIGEDFDELFGGLDEGADVDLPSAPEADATASVSVAPSDETGDKLLDTSELKVEMEELLASAAGMSSSDEAPEIAPAADETGSFSAEIKSLADDGVDIDLDFAGPEEDDDDATELMEGIAPDDTQEATVAGSVEELAAGSDDETVLASALSDEGEGFSDVDFGEIFADESDDGTAVMKTDADGFAGDNDSTVLAQSPFDASADGDAAAQTRDELTFQGVFDDAADDEPVIDLGGDEFSAAVFGDGGIDRSSDDTQESAAVDLDVGDALSDSAGESGDNTTVKVAASDLALPDLDEGGSNEVGTKLDLARAYMEMGDPDGARGILNEVIEEGDESQKQDAQALLGALP